MSLLHKIIEMRKNYLKIHYFFCGFRLVTITMSINIKLKLTGVKLLRFKYILLLFNFSFLILSFETIVCIFQSISNRNL